MTRRKAHTRTNRRGTTFSVREHAFNAGTTNREFDLRWKGGQAYVNGSVTYQTRCPQCKRSVYFYRNEHGSRVFFDSLGKPWPKHGCTHGLRRLQSMSIAEAEPVTKSNYTRSPLTAGASKEMFVDIAGLNQAVRQYTRDIRKTGIGSKNAKKPNKKKKQ